MTEKKRHMVFVYGTLRKHGENHHVLKDAKCVIETAWIRGTLYDTGFGYPAFTFAPSGNVYGEVYEVDDEGLSCLDELEGYVADRADNLYERYLKAVLTEKGPMEAIIYTVDHNPTLCKRPIPCGDWMKWDGQSTFEIP